VSRPRRQTYQLSRLLFPPAAVGAYVGGWVYKLDPNLPWIITSGALLVCALMVYLFVHEPEEAQL